jgi:hypothetical protein
MPWNGTATTTARAARRMIRAHEHFGKGRFNPQHGTCRSRHPR